MALDPAVLKKVDLFASLDDKEAKKIAPLFKERNYNAGDVIAEEGKHGVGFFVIESGTAKVTSHGEERRTLGPGSHFGEVALIDDGQRTATVTADDRRQGARPRRLGLPAAGQGGFRPGLEPPPGRRRPPARPRRLPASRQPLAEADQVLLRAGRVARERDGLDAVERLGDEAAEDDAAHARLAATPRDLSRRLAGRGRRGRPSPRP